MSLLANIMKHMSEERERGGVRLVGQSMEMEGEKEGESSKHANTLMNMPLKTHCYILLMYDNKNIYM